MTQHVLPVPAFSYPASCECCANCAHYYQHYGRYVSPDDPERLHFYILNDGHCVYPRLKNRKPDDFCEHFERRL